MEVAVETLVDIDIVVYVEVESSVVVEVVPVKIVENSVLVNRVRDEGRDTSRS